MATCSMNYEFWGQFWGRAGLTCRKFIALILKVAVILAYDTVFDIKISPITGDMLTQPRADFYFSSAMASLRSIHPRDHTSSHGPANTLVVRLPW